MFLVSIADDPSGIMVHKLAGPLSSGGGVGPKLLTKMLKKDVTALYKARYDISPDKAVVTITKRIFPLDEETRGVLSRFHALSEDYLAGLTPDIGYGETSEVREVWEIAKEYVEKAVRKGKKLGKRDLDRLNERALRQVVSDSPKGPSIGYEVEEPSKGKEQLWFPFFTNGYTSGRLGECKECCGLFIHETHIKGQETCGTKCSQKRYHRSYMREYRKHGPKGKKS